MNKKRNKELSITIGGPLFLVGLIFLYRGYFVTPSENLAIIGLLFCSLSVIWVYEAFTNGSSEILDSSIEDQRIITENNDYSDLTPDEFEYHIANLWEKQGWNTEVTSSTADKGIDVIARKNEIYSEKVLIQAKKYEPGNKVTSREVQQYSSLKQQENEVDEVIIVTTSSFTSNARDRARDLNVKLINREGLSQLREKYLEDA